MMVQDQVDKPIKKLVLDAAPLLTQSPIQHLATEFYTTPQVIHELRDDKSRLYLELLAIKGVKINIQQPDPISFAKGTLLTPLSSPSDSRFSLQLFKTYRRLLCPLSPRYGCIGSHIRPRGTRERYNKT